MIGRLLGMKVVEEGDGYKVLRFPLWASESMVRRAAENVRRDAALIGREIWVTVGHRYVRVEEELSDPDVLGVCSKCGGPIWRSHDWAAGRHIGPCGRYQ